MQKKIILVMAICLTLFGCKQNNEITPLDAQPKVLKFDSYDAMRVAVTSSFLERIEISQIKLQRVSTGTQRVMDYAYTYPTLGVPFTLASDMTLTVEKYNFSGQANVGTYDAGLVKLKINGQTYQGVLTTGYFVTDGRISNMKIVFSQPSTPVPGQSSNYADLINAMNITYFSDTQRPNLNIPSDLKVLGFNTITVYILS